MIPIIGLIIGMYTCTRYLDFIKTKSGMVKAASIGGFVLTVIFMLTLIFTPTP